MSIIWFISIGIVGLIVLVAASLLKLRWWWQAVLAIVLTGMIASLLNLSEPVHLGGERWFNISPFRELMLFAAMLIGMIARVLSVEIEKWRVSGIRTSGPQVSRWDLVYPMLVSVPTFAALLSQTNTESLTLQALLLSFQNGFFWQTILKREESR
jgi:hypothetical protein